MEKKITYLEEKYGAYFREWIGERDDDKHTFCKIYGDMMYTCELLKPYKEYSSYIHYLLVALDNQMASDCKKLDEIIERVAK